MGRRVLAVVAGMIVACVVVAGGEIVGYVLFPRPPLDNISNWEEARAIMARLPLGAYVSALVAHALGSFLGGYTASYVSREAQLTNGVTVGGLLLLTGVMDLAQVPHPTWFMVALVLQYIPCAYLGARLGEPF